MLFLYKRYVAKCRVRLYTSRVKIVELDRELVAPIYQQIGKLIRRRIEAGELRPGEPIPSEEKLVKEFGVARTTVRRAVAWLRDQGLVYTVPQRGTFVGDPESARAEHSDQFAYDTPPYKQIAELIKQRIERGELRPHRPIPSEAQMSQEFGVARTTARRAVAYLREQGLIYTVPQRGSYVAPPEDESD